MQDVVTIVHCQRKNTTHYVPLCRESDGIT